MRRVALALFVVIALTLVAAPALQAQTGNIDPSQRHAWTENGGWLDFRPAFGGVTVLPTHLSGYAWHESVGWVKLGANGSGPYENDASPTTWGVNLNSVTGVLSGFAWSESAGWIRMDPAFGGVTYDGLTHQMSGWAWSESYGWIHFRSTTPTAYGVAVSCGSLTGTVTGGGTVCTGNSSTVTVTVSGGAAPYIVTLDNGGGTQTGAGPAFTFTVGPASTTTYSVASLTDGLSCTGAGNGSATVTVNEVPATSTPSSNSPVCIGSTINLSTPAVAGATYAWTGPNGFSSADQNPTIPSATVAMAGTYSVTATVGGCASPASTTSVTVNPIPATPTAGNGGAVCEGGTILLTASTVAGATYAWTGPNGFSSSAQNPTIPSATVAMAGTYSVTATVGGCASPASTTSVTVNPIPASPTAGNGGAVCEGGTITLTASTVSGATYAWTGPNGFTSAAQNPTIPSATTAMAGTYSVTATVNGCTSSASTTSVIVNPIPATPTAGNGGAVCEGGTITLTASAVAGATYAWTGPNGFTSADQNPTIPTVTVAMAGTYIVTATVNGCASPANTTSVTVNPIPATPTAGNGGAVCEGGTITLTASTVPGATYAWTGPNGFTSAAQNPTIPSATVAMAGTYSVTATVNGCTSPASTTNVTVNPIPATPTAGNSGAVCEGGTISLTASTVPGATYAWTGPNGFSSSAQNPTIPSATVAMAGTYSVTATVNGCTSPAGTTSVTVNPIPSMPTAGNGGAVCEGGTISLTASTVPGATYAWTGPNGFTSAAQNPTIPSATVAMAGTYSVTATVNGCTSPAGTTSVTVNPIPSTPTAGNSGAVCEGGTISLTASTVPGATYAWTGPNGFTSAAQNPTIPSATVAMAGTYSVTTTVNGCTSPASTTNVTVNPIPSTPTAGNAGAVCEGGTITLTASTVPGATYAWTGPNGFTSAAQNPTIPSATVAMAGTYSVTATVNGCTSPAGTTSVTVNPIPSTPTAGNGGAVCEGGMISLTASTIPGATYAWTGPNGFTSSAQNPTIPSATIAMAGTYSVTATVNGCASADATTAVVIDASPVTPVITAPPSVWPQQSFTVSVPAVAGVTYDWVVTNGTITAGSGTRSITITAGTTGSVGVSVTETNEVTGCISEEASVSMPIGILATRYYTLSPCRLFDTRESSGAASAAPSLGPGETRVLAIGTRCGIPTSTVRSLSVNLTVTSAEADGEIVLVRGDLPATAVPSSIAYRAGRTRANNGILELSWSGDGTIKVHNSSIGSVHFILDVNGFFQ